MTSIYDRSALLSLNNPDFVADLERLVRGAYESDMRHGDVTTESLNFSDRTARAVLMAKGEGVFCGQLELSWLMQRFARSVTYELGVEDGFIFHEGAELIYFEGSAAEILRVERTLLNLLQRLCGIATRTREFVRLAHPCQVAATRKTLYGLLDKRAVAVGGGLTHRLTLGDAPMYKDTHFALVDGDWGQILEGIERLPRAIPFVTIEVHAIESVGKLLKELPMDLSWPIVLLLDNFKPNILAEALSGLNKPSNVYFEASGGITLESVSVYAKTGVDVMSVGALTHTVTPVDLSLQIMV